MGISKSRVLSSFYAISDCHLHCSNFPKMSRKEMNEFIKAYMEEWRGPYEFVHEIDESFELENNNEQA